MINAKDEKLIKSLHPQVRPMCRLFLVNAREAGVNCHLTFGYRDWDQQLGIYLIGRADDGKIVTNAKPGWSWHNYGMAWDVAVYVPGLGKIDWNTACDYDKDGLPDWAELVSIGHRLGLVCGADFKSIKDWGHFEWHPGLSLVEARKIVMAQFTVEVLWELELDLAGPFASGGPVD